ncbi:MAG: glycosyltransferase family 1 protein [Nitrospiraceae bacterium]|nr:MAG: glycosyltransferase family 1 protein [Nitrospiraceae bacterium]
MRILHTEWSDGLGGQEKRVLAEAAGLSERGHYVALVCREHASIKDEAVRAGLDVHIMPMRKLYDVDSIARLTKFLKDNRFDVVNTHSGVDSWIGGISARFASVPVLARTRHLNLPLKRNLLNFIHYLPDVYITCGDNMKDHLVKGCGFPAHKVVSIPTGVSPEFFNVKKNPEARTRYGFDADSIVITNVGILRSIKGHEVTLKAVKAVVSAYPRARFLLVGDGPRKDILERLVQDLGISKHVIFTGFVKDIPEIYSFSDISVLSSWSEGLPQSLMQAMAAGVPVVATKVGGVPEVVIHEKTGLLIESGDHEGLAKGIIRLLGHPDMSAQFAEHARRLVMEGHSAGHMVDKIEGLYNKLLATKTQRHK